MVEFPSVPAPGRSTLRHIPLVALLYFALTLALAYPLTRNPAGTLLSAHSDAFLFMWTLAWDTHAFTHQPFSIFDANIYYPERHTLAYSENMIGSAFFAAPVLWLTGNLVLAMNLVALLSCVLCGLGTYMLARRIGVTTSGAALSGLIFAFSPPRFLRLDQLFLTTIQWMPFSLAAQHAYWDSGRKRDLRLAAAFFTLQVLTSGHGAVFLTLASLGLFAYRVALGAPLAVSRRLRDLGLPGALLLLPSALIVLPYMSVQAEMGLRRTLDWAIAPSSFFASPSYVHSFVLSVFFPNATINETAGAELFPGYLPILLAIAAFWWPRHERAAVADGRSADRWSRAALLLDRALLVTLLVALWVTAIGPIRLSVRTLVLFSATATRRAWMFVLGAALLRIAIAWRAPIDAQARIDRFARSIRRSIDRRRSDVAVFYALLTLVSLWLSIGPPYGLWRFVYWLPGLNFIRAPSRFTLLSVLGLAVLAGIGFDRLSARLTATGRCALAIGLGALLAGELAVPLSAGPYRVDIPAVDRWLDTQPKPFVVAEAPVPHARNEWMHTAYMFHSMAHWQKTVHGYSGLRPQLHEELYTQLTRFPDHESLMSLQGLGVTYVVVHIDLYPPEEWTKVSARIDAFKSWLKLEHADGDGRVYSLQRKPSETTP